MVEQVLWISLWALIIVIWWILEILPVGGHFGLAFSVIRWSLNIPFYYCPIRASYLAQPRIGGSAGSFVSVTGMMLFVAGAAIIVLAVPALVSATGIEADKPTKLVTTGMFRLMRHPQAGGSFLVFTGWALFNKSLYTFSITPAIFGVLLLHILAEERFTLLNVFGSEYAEYKRRVPALFPLPIKIVLVALYGWVFLLMIFGVIFLR